MMIVIGVAFFSTVLLIQHSAFAIQKSHDPTLEDQIGNLTQTKLVHDGAILILNQTMPKLTYKMGENIPVNTALINIGNKTASIAYEEPEFFLEIKNQTSDLVWPPHARVGWIPEFDGQKTLDPGENFSSKPWAITNGWNYPPPLMLDTPGNYTVISVGMFTFSPTRIVTVYHPEAVWSKPIQITVLPEQYVESQTSSTTVGAPEFPLAIPILLISIMSLIIFYRMKFNKTI